MLSSVILIGVLTQ